MLLGFTEVLTVYFSVKPGADEKAAITPWRNVKLGTDGKAAITPWKNVKPGEDKMTGLVESVGPERI